MSGLIKGSQINWACLTKEAYAIYMFTKKPADYLEDVDIVLRSDYLSFHKFLEQNTLNTKVNRWVIKISPFGIEFQYIKGIKNKLADTMSRLVEIDPKTELEAEPYGYEYGCYMFKELPPLTASVLEVDDEPSESDPPSEIKDGTTLLSKNTLINDKIQELGHSKDKTSFVPRSLIN